MTNNFYVEMIGQSKSSIDIGIRDLTSCGSFSGRMAAASRLGLALLGKSGDESCV